MSAIDFDQESPRGLLPSGIPALDALMGGGFQRGALTEVFGGPDSGKTSVGLRLIAQAQKAGGTGVFIDSDHKLTDLLVRQNGVDPKRTLVSRPATGEQALETCRAMVKSGGPDVVVLDTVASLAFSEEAPRPLGSDDPGTQALLVSSVIAEITEYLAASGVCFLLLNQVRSAQVAPEVYEDVTPGGKALGFYASARLSLERVSLIRQNGKVVGYRVAAQLLKSTHVPPLRKTTFELYA